MIADKHFKKSEYFLKNLDQKKMIGSEIMKLFYKKFIKNVWEKN